MKKRLYNKKAIILIFMLLFCIRIIKLDVDAPTHPILQYTRVDEGHYAKLAIQNVMYDQMSEADSLISGQYKQWELTSFLLTFFCTLTLWIFGDTYYGLRMAAVIVAFLSCFIIFFLVSKLEKEKNIPNHFPLLAMGCLVLLNFPYLIASRFIEPSVFRIPPLCICAWFIWHEHQARRPSPRYFILGVLSILAIVLGYITNLFMLVPCGILLLLELWQHKEKPIQKILQFLGGIIAGYGLGELILYTTLGHGFLEDSIEIYALRGTDHVSYSLSALKWNIHSLLITNFLSYSPVLFVLAVIAVLYVLFKGHKNKNIYQIYISWLAIGYATQSIFTNDTLVRKGIVFYPIVMLNIAYLLIDRREILTAFTKLAKKYQLAITFFIIALSGGSVFLMLRRLSYLAIEDMRNPIRLIIIAFNIISLIGLILAVCLRQIAKERFIWLLIILPLLVPNIAMTYEYVVCAGYEDKEIMTDMGHYVNGEYVMGGYAYGYSLYNDMIPVSITYDKSYPQARYERARALIATGKVYYFIGNNEEELLQSWVEGTGYTWQIVKEYRKTPKDYGGNQKVYILKIVPSY